MSRTVKEDVMSTSQDAYQRGQRDYYAGIRRTQNPYDGVDSLSYVTQYIPWEQGWSSAWKEDQENRFRAAQREAEIEAENYVPERECDCIAWVSISETECQCMDCLRVSPKPPKFKSDFPQYDRG